MGAATLAKKGNSMPASSNSQYDLKKVLKYIETNQVQYRETLEELARIPSVSAEGYPVEEVLRSAEATSSVMRRVGLQNVRIWTLPVVHPYAYGEWMGAKGPRPSFCTDTMTCS